MRYFFPVPSSSSGPAMSAREALGVNMDHY